MLTLVVPADNPAGIASAADLAKPGIKIVLAQEDVPVGGYARDSICNMAADTATYGDDFVADVAGNVVSQEDNVRSVLTKVALGEADAGIVYTSDVTDDVVAARNSGRRSTSSPPIPSLRSPTATRSWPRPISPTSCRPTARPFSSPTGSSPSTNPLAPHPARAVCDRHVAARNRSIDHIAIRSGSAAAAL